MNIMLCSCSIISNTSNMLFYPSTNCIKLNATFDTYNEHVYSQCFFAIIKRSQFHIARSVSHLPFATGSIYVYQSGKQGSYLHGGIKRTVTTTSSQMHSYRYTDFTYTENECSQITKYFAIGFQVGPKERASHPKGSSGRKKYGKRRQERHRAAQ